ncbi:crossover junction endonuclease MUS81-like isoform X3 [Suricata suricatta]|uniref:crossover junction endonuclease MUS81-like isoform X3 n=1 Tax=Suricata suricatta TaxID=37032 RepID=UPI00115529B2|nr:crossover junction endonuclease MUS81-like isoform X3 [Suricata suricatta]
MLPGHELGHLQEVNDFNAGAIENKAQSVREVFARQLMQEQELLLRTIKCGQLQRNLGPTLNRTLSQLYCSYGPMT